jgi:GNAT superfamily N-acetyltransferase
LSFFGDREEVYKMPLLDLDVRTAGDASPDVAQVFYDFGLSDTVWGFQRAGIEVPDLSEDWSVGAIIGPSGSGKSLLADRAFGRVCALEAGWPDRVALIDALGPLPLMQRVRALTSVGLGSVPCWVRPYSSLSLGERYRAALAREFLRSRELLVCDEFTSVLDRDTARFASFSLSRAIRRGDGPKRFVAVTCHSDVAQWLEADWVVDMVNCRLTRGRLRRPDLQLRIERCKGSIWGIFSVHHYLSGAINRTCRCFVATIAGEPVGFVALLRSICKRPIRRISRLVVLPTFQGCGIGTSLLDWVAEENAKEGYYTTITAVHPSIEAWLKRSGRWKIWPARNKGYDWASFALAKGIKVRETGRACVRAEYTGFESLVPAAPPAKRLSKRAARLAGGPMVGTPTPGS